MLSYPASAIRFPKRTPLKDKPAARNTKIIEADVYIMKRYLYNRELKLVLVKWIAITKAKVMLSQNSKTVLKASVMLIRASISSASVIAYVQYT